MTVDADQSPALGIRAGLRVRGFAATKKHVVHRIDSGLLRNYDRIHWLHPSTTTQVVELVPGLPAGGRDFSLDGSVVVWAICGPYSFETEWPLVCIRMRLNSTCRRLALGTYVSLRSGARRDRGRTTAARGGAAVCTCLTFNGLRASSQVPRKLGRLGFILLLVFRIPLA
jgi:hypothetical protein